MDEPRLFTQDGDDARPAGRFRVLMVDRQILALWADAARHRQTERLQAIVRCQQPPAS